MKLLTFENKKKLIIFIYIALKLKKLHMLVDLLCYTFRQQIHIYMIGSGILGTLDKLRKNSIIWASNFFSSTNLRIYVHIIFFQNFCEVEANVSLDLAQDQSFTSKIFFN